MKVEVADLPHVSNVIDAGATLARQLEWFLSDDDALARNADTMRQALGEYRAVVMAMSDG